MLLEETEEIGQQRVVQAVVTEVEDALHGTVLHMLNHPLQVLGLQVGDTHVAHHTFLLQFHQSRQCLVYYQLQSTLAVALKLNVVYIDQVDIIDVQTFHTLVDTVSHAFGRVIPQVHAILTIASHLRREVIFVAGNAFQGLAQHRLSLIMAIVGRHIDEIHTVLHRRIDSLDTLFLTDAVEHTTQRRSTETQVRYLHAGFSDFIVYHNLLIHYSLFTFFFTFTTRCGSRPI